MSACRIGLSIVAASVALLVPLGALAHAAAPAAAENTKLTNIVETFSRAQANFDQATLRRLTTTDYLEVSPIGNGDPREAMLGFYAPDKKMAAPSLTVSDPTVVRGDGNAMVLVRLWLAMRGASAEAKPGQMRASFLLCQEGGDWKIAFAQYTPLRSTR
jgi:hypothetical protein